MKMLLVLALMIVASCSVSKVELTPEPKATITTFTEPTAVPKFKLLGVHTVVPLDTLWSISDHWYGDPVLWPSIYEINKSQIKDLDLIYTGQKFDIPKLDSPVVGEEKTLLEQGYLDAYRVYKEKGRVDAEDYNPTK